MTDDIAKTALAYDELRAARPDLFDNPPDCPIRIAHDPAERATIEAAARERLVAKGVPPDLAREWAATGLIHQDQYMVLIRDPVVFADGRHGTYWRFFERPLDGVGSAILPRIGDDLVLIHHFRHADRRHHWEIPRGFAEPGLSCEDNARKEVAEEIGGTVETLTDLGLVVPNTGVSGTSARLFLAELGSLGAPQVADGIVAIRRVPIAEFRAMVADGSLTDPFALCCWARAVARGLIAA